MLTNLPEKIICGRGTDAYRSVQHDLYRRSVIYRCVWGETMRYAQYFGETDPSQGGDSDRFEAFIWRKLFFIFIKRSGNWIKKVEKRQESNYRIIKQSKKKAAHKVRIEGGLQMISAGDFKNGVTVEN